MLAATVLPNLGLVIVGFLGPRVLGWSDIVGNGRFAPLIVDLDTVKNRKL